MSQIDTLRPVSVNNVGAGTAVPSGTLASVTADDNDATYIDFDLPDSGDNWNLRVEPHTPGAGYQRHQIRGRIRARTDTGTAFEDIDLGRGTAEYIEYDTVTVTSAFSDIPGSWYSSPGYGLGTAGSLADLNIGGGWMELPEGEAATELRTAECYVDIDCRLRPQYSPEVRDAAGVDQAGGTVTDTTQPTLLIGGVAYDDLPALDWSVEVTDATAAVVFSLSGSGTPPTEVPVTTSLANGDFTATFTVRSTIRGSDAFEHEQVLLFEIDNEVPPPSPPLVTVEESFGGYLVSWSNPGGQEWDADYPLVAEVWRDDCTGSQRIAVIPDGLNGSYLDLAIPQLDPQPVNSDGVCTTAATACDITYRVRYWGYISNTVEIPDVLPNDLILAWPGTTGSIPDGWSRVAALDGYYPRGATGTGAPSATGGSSSHTHTTPNHRHTVGAHSHGVAGTTGSSGDSTQTQRFNGADKPTANQSHTHNLPDRTGTAVQYSSGLTVAGVNSVDNDPPTLEVIWISSDGTETSYPVGILGWSAESVSGWVAHSAASGRFLKGAATISGGGGSYGSSTHHHTVASHDHTVASHDHTIPNTGLSNPVAATEAETGGTSPRWVPRHTHLMNVVPAASTDLIANTGGNTSEVSREPRHRRLRVLRNTGGGAQTRIIGLYMGALADLDPVLTVCDGSNGTPDMRGLFCRDIGGAGGVNVVAGADNHSHTVPNHTHSISAHLHDVQVGAATGPTYERRTSGDQGSVPTHDHTHSAGNSFPAAPPISSAGAGTTGTSSLVPVYKEAHFVRVDGTVAGGSLPAPELRVSDFAEVTVPALEHGDDLDRLSSLTQRMAVATSRSSAFARLVTDSTPINGGTHTVSNSVPSEDLTLTIAVQGMPAIDALEELLSSDRLYWSPLGGEPGWFAPDGWTVSGPAPDVKVVQISMARVPWPTTPDPEEYL